jgi:hypothetical protein
MIPPWLALSALKRLPWKLIGYGVAALAVALLVWRVLSWRADAQKLPVAVKALATEKQAHNSTIQRHNDEISRYKADLAKQEADTAALNEKLADAATQTETLQKALSRARLTIHAPNPTPGQPDVVRLSRVVRLCLNASATGAASQVADCKAAGVPESATP